jgi:hypothetical protein
MEQIRYPIDPYKSIEEQAKRYNQAPKTDSTS